eukprot:474644-Pyramimonas_sp.AAC.1
MLQIWPRFVTGVVAPHAAGNMLAPPPSLPTDNTAETHANQHPACLQGALGFFGFDGFAMEGATFPYQNSMDVLGFQGFDYCG